MAAVYPFYDIIIWSATSMKWVEVRPSAHSPLYSPHRPYPPQGRLSARSAIPAGSLPLHQGHGILDGDLVSRGDPGLVVPTLSSSGLLIFFEMADNRTPLQWLLDKHVSLSSAGSMRWVDVRFNPLITQAFSRRARPLIHGPRVLSSHFMASTPEMPG